MATLGLNATDPYLLYPISSIGAHALIANRDFNNSILIGPQEGLYSVQPSPQSNNTNQSGDQGSPMVNPTVTSIDPGGYIEVDGTWDVWGIAATTSTDQNGNPIPVPVSVQAGATALVGGPAATAAALVSSGLATAIATATQTALATGGISLLGNPTLLYNVNATSPPSQAGIPIGATTLAPGYGVTTKTAAAPIFDNYIGFPNAITMQKWYLNEDQFPTSPTSDYKSLVALGTKIILCVRPDRAAVLNNDTATINAQIAAMQTTIAAFNNPVGTVQWVVLWQECNERSPADNTWYFNFSGSNPAQPTYAAYWAAYAAAIETALPGGLAYGCGIVDSQQGTARCTDLLLSLGAPAPDAVFYDWYATAFTTASGTHSFAPDSVYSASGMSLLQAAGTIPIGHSEYGYQVGGNPSPTIWQPFVNKIISILQPLVNTGKAVCLVYYSGQGAGSGNDITGPTDFKVPGIQQLNNTLGGSSVPGGGSGLTIAAGASATLTPLNPSPNKGFAITDGLSYELWLNVIAGVGSTLPLLTVEFDWHSQDQTTHFPNDRQDWYVPMGTNGTNGTYLIGKGPMSSEYLSVKLTNNDTVTCTVGGQIMQTGRPVTQHVLQWDAMSSVSVPTFTLSDGAAGFAGAIGIVAGRTVNAGATLKILMGMMNCDSYMRLNVANAAGTETVHCTLSALPQTGVWGSTNLFSAYLPDAGGGAEANEAIFDVKLPRAPTLLTVVNNDTANITFSAVITTSSEYDN